MEDSLKPPAVLALGKLVAGLGERAWCRGLP